MPADLIVYALVAAGLVFWLRSVLGTRHGEEHDRPNPFLAPEQTNQSPLSDHYDPAEGLSPEERIADLAKKSGEKIGVDNKTAEHGLLAIAGIDKNFDIHMFLEGAQDAFVMIVESYAEGDRETLRSLLSESVYKAFESGIAAREDKGETQMTEIHAIRKAQVMAARLEGKQALITVRFVADETSVTRDKDGEIIAGDPNKTTQMKDLWTFGRDVKSKDPTWLVYETRADHDDDNELIPNTH